MDIIHTASLIFNQLAEDNILSPIQLSEEVHHYVQAKFAFINIASTCLAQQQNPLIAFETTLQAQHLSGQLTNDVYTILWWNLDLILTHYKNCLKTKPLKKSVNSPMGSPPQQTYNFIYVGVRRYFTTTVVRSPALSVIFS